MIGLKLTAIVTLLSVVTTLAANVSVVVRKTGVKAGEPGYALAHVKMFIPDTELTLAKNNLPMWSGNTFSCISRDGLRWVSAFETDDRLRAGQSLTQLEERLQIYGIKARIVCMSLS